MAQGSGGAALNINYRGADTNGAAIAIPSTRLYTPETASTTGTSNAVNVGNRLNVNGNATVDLFGRNFTTAQVGAINAASNSTLHISGLAGKMLRSDTTFLNGGTATFDTETDLALGTVLDNGTAVTIIKQGAGRRLAAFDKPGLRKHRFVIRAQHAVARPPFARKRNDAA